VELQSSKISKLELTKRYADQSRKPSKLKGKVADRFIQDLVSSLNISAEQELGFVPSKRQFEIGFSPSNKHLLRNTSRKSHQTSGKFPSVMPQPLNGDLIEVAKVRPSDTSGGSPSTGSLLKEQSVPSLKHLYK
jgi:hypothetical protein